MNLYENKKQVPYFQDTMAQNIHSHSKRENWGHRKERWNLSKTKTQQQKFKCYCSMPGILGPWWWAVGPRPAPLQWPCHLQPKASLLGWLHWLLAAFLGKCSTCLASLTSWGLSNFLGSPSILSLSQLHTSPSQKLASGL
jgi:hypothetical protein